MTRRHAIEHGIRQWCGTLQGDVVTLSGVCVFRRWSDTGLELSPGKSRKGLELEMGDWIVLWGRTVDETEPVVFDGICLSGEWIKVLRTKRVVRDGEVRVVL